MTDTTVLPPSVRLEVPYRSQLDNRNNPHGSDNVTAITMALLYLGKTGKRLGNYFEDELYEYMEDNHLDRRAPEDLAKVVHDWGCRDDFTFQGSIDMARAALAMGNPCVIHGYFTRYGHIVTLVGYNPNGFIVHDSNGEYFIGGYDTRANGAFLHYSYKLIRKVAMPDNQLWLHRISA